MQSTQHLYVRKASAGSGKTYTLAAHYVALLMAGESFRSILAVTFTNKATAEMKERILGYLYAIATHISEEDTQGFLGRVREIYAELGYDAKRLSNDYCTSRAKAVHQDILSHYDEMRIQTIDAFLQTLLAGMVQKLNGAVGYQVELDTKKIVSEAVDNLVTEGAKQETAVCKAITAYMSERIADEKNWDIRKGLNEIGMELYKELLQEKKKQLVFDSDTIKDMKNALAWEKNAPVQDLKDAVEKAMRWSDADFKNGKDVTSRVNLYHQQLTGKIEGESTAFTDFSPRALKGMGIYTDENGVEHTDGEMTFYNGGDADKAAIQQELLSIRQMAQACRKAYLHDRYCTKYMNDMVLMGALLARIQEQIKANNSCLLAETANTLAQALAPGDADFILEKAGIRYRHIMLDEFQDTSTLQWENFRCLLQEILAQEKGSTLIVGDIKQSIYRWRNGNWEIMASLQRDWPLHYNTSTPQLVRNFRSEKQVVKFNLETMQYLAAQEKDSLLYDEGYNGENLSDYYRHGHEGGYVQVKCFAQSSSLQESDLRKQVRKNILVDMFHTMEDLLSRGVPPEQLLILFRRNKEAKELLDVLQEQTKEHAEMFPHLSQTPIVSNNCFQLQFSQHVNLLVAALRYIYTEDGAALLYVQQFAPNTDLPSQAKSMQMMALTDLVERLIQVLIMPLPSEVEDLSYINSFRDKVRDYVATNGSDGSAFIRVWDEQMAGKTIPAVDTQGIRMMTIHAAKGLEAGNVFIPFCDWDMEEDMRDSKLWCEVSELKNPDEKAVLLPIPQNSYTPDAGFEKEYVREHQLQRVDNLNLLYVALTRAAECLYVYADVKNKVDKNGNGKPRHKWDVGQLLAERCGLWGQLSQLFSDKRLGGEGDYVVQDYGTLQIEEKTKKEDKKTADPFSFLHAEEKKAQCYSNDSHIEFRQSQESRTYGWNIAAMSMEQQDIEQRALGTICHNILSTIGLYTTTDAAIQAVKKAVERAYRQGVIPNEALCQRIEGLLLTTVSDERMRDWYTGNWHIQCEEAILLKDEHGEVEERRMDRVMWSRDRQEAIVLDYKFGQDNTQYDKQVRRYMDICRRMGATKVRGYLWIAAESRLEEVLNKA